MVCEVADLNEVHFREGLIVARLLNVQDGDYVFMVEVAQQFHLSQCTQAEHGVIEWSDFLDGNLLARWLMQSRAACTVREMHLEARSR